MKEAFVIHSLLIYFEYMYFIMTSAGRRIMWINENVHHFCCSVLVDVEQKPPQRSLLSLFRNIMQTSSTSLPEWWLYSDVMWWYSVYELVERVVTITNKMCLLKIDGYIWRYKQIYIYTRDRIGYDIVILSLRLYWRATREIKEWGWCLSYVGWIEIIHLVLFILFRQILLK